MKIPKAKLGNSGLKVSRIGFGTFDFGVPALNINPEEGGQILAESYKLGVNYWDTSDDYGSHPHIASALKRLPRREIVISTKTSARNSDEARNSLKNSLKELETDYVDIFMLHLVKIDWLNGCERVLKELTNLKSTGTVKALGLSTHSVEVVKKAAQFKKLDVILATCCKADQALIDGFRDRILLEDGSMQGMHEALGVAHDSGKGIIAMKVLGDNAPPLVDSYESSIKCVARLGFVDAMVIGMQNLDQVKKNVNALIDA